jgi:hypothetical protein
MDRPLFMPGQNHLKIPAGELIVDREDGPPWVVKDYFHAFPLETF